MHRVPLAVVLLSLASQPALAQRSTLIQQTGVSHRVFSSGSTRASMAALERLTGPAAGSSLRSAPTQPASRRTAGDWVMARARVRALTDALGHGRDLLMDVGYMVGMFFDGEVPRPTARLAEAATGDPSTLAISAASLLVIGAAARGRRLFAETRYSRLLSAGSTGSTGSTGSARGSSGEEFTVLMPGAARVERVSSRSRAASAARAARAARPTPAAQTSSPFAARVRFRRERTRREAIPLFMASSLDGPRVARVEPDSRSMRRASGLGEAPVEVVSVATLSTHPPGARAWAGAA